MAGYSFPAVSEAASLAFVDEGVTVPSSCDEVETVGSFLGVRTESMCRVFLYYVLGNLRGLHSYSTELAVY